MNKSELVATIAEVSGMTKAQAGHALNRVLDKMADAMVKRERVSLAGFGSFRVVEKAEQKGRNPQTVQSLIIPAHNVVRFKPARVLWDKKQ
ncbi:MAG: HU family DNA-binding protein [Pseudomonadota bacterium]